MAQFSPLAVSIVQAIKMKLKSCTKLKA